MHSGAGFFCDDDGVLQAELLMATLEISPFHGFRCAASIAVEMTILTVI
jgi:hypothetical protein